MIATPVTGPGRVGKLGLIALGLCAGAVLSELLARVVVPDADGHGPPAIFASSPVIPFTTRPNAEHLGIRHPAGDYVYSARLDAAGFRRNGTTDAPIDLDGRGTLVIGDSFAFGMGVNDDDTVPAHLGSSGLAGSCVAPVVNGGWIAGNNPATAAAWLASQAATRRPRVVLHFVFPANDVDDIIPLHLERDGNGDLIRVSEEVAYVDATGRRRFADGAGLGSARDWLRAHVRLYQPVYRLLAIALPGTFGEQRKVRRDRDEARVVAVGALGQAARWARARQARYVVALVPSVEEVLAARWGQAAAVFIDAVQRAGLETANLLDGDPPLTRAHYFGSDAHWNPSGHVVVASQLLPRLMEFARRDCRAVERTEKG